MDESLRTDAETLCHQPVKKEVTIPIDVDKSELKKRLAAAVLADNELKRLVEECVTLFGGKQVKINALRQSCQADNRMISERLKVIRSLQFLSRQQKRKVMIVMAKMERMSKHKPARVLHIEGVLIPRRKRILKKNVLARMRIEYLKKCSREFSQLYK